MELALVAALHSKYSFLPADRRLDLSRIITLNKDFKEECEQRKHRLNMKRSFDRRHVTKIPKTEAGHFIVLMIALQC